MAKYRIKEDLEVVSQTKVVVEAITIETNDTIKVGHNGQTTASESQRLDCIYDNEPLGFEKDPLTSTRRIYAHDPLEEIDIGNGIIKRPTFISAKIEPNLKS